jgi:hypothetical protein
VEEKPFMPAAPQVDHKQERLELIRKRQKEQSYRKAFGIA